MTNLSNSLNELKILEFRVHQANANVILYVQFLSSILWLWKNVHIYFTSFLLSIFWYWSIRIKDRNGMDLTEAEDMKKRWQKYTEELYKKELHNPDNHNGVITPLEPDLLEWEVKWALGSIATNKASGGDGIPVALFQILKDDAVKVLQSICRQIWITQHWPQDWKRSVFIPIPKKGNDKECSNYRTIALISHASFFWRRKWQTTPVFLSGESQGWGSLGGLLSMGSHRVGHQWSDLAVAAHANKVMLKILQARLQQYVNRELADV